MQRGTLNSDHTGLTSTTFAQCWGLDATGNWSNFREDDDGNGIWNLNQDRTANQVNGITDVTESTGPSWTTPAYSKAGNMTTVPKPADPTTSFTATYDAWNRLTKLVDTTSSDTVAEYEYDGAKRRTIQKSYTSGTLDETRHLYYTEPSKWQVIEERVDSDVDPERQFVWGSAISTTSSLGTATPPIAVPLLKDSTHCRTQTGMLPALRTPAEPFNKESYLMCTVKPSP